MTERVKNRGRRSDEVAANGLSHNIENTGRRLRRRGLSLAATTAALGLTGCGMMGGDRHAAEATAPLVMTAQQRSAADRVREYTSNLDVALDHVDRERLRAAAEKKTVVPASAAIPAAAAPTPGPVILASSGTQENTSVVKPVAVIAATPPAVAVPAPATALITPALTPPPSSPSAMGAMMATATPAPALAVAEPTPVVAAAMALPMVPAAPIEPTVEEALAVIRKRVAAHPTLNTALALALLDNGEGKADELAKALPASDQKMLADLLGALEGMSASKSKGATLADRAAPLVDAAKKWQAEADLTLPRLVLATRVDSFGVYTPVEPKFEQGKKHTVIVYCEVANFSSKKADDGWYQTRLSQQETLITEDGLLVWRPNAEEVEDRSMNQRRDFYLVKKLMIPENLAAGKYTLRMSVTDRNATPPKISMVSMEIEIAAK